MATKKRVLVIADTHCGHRIGLTPPQWQYPPMNRDRRKWAKAQAACFGFFEKEIEALKPIDVLVCNGDMIDGRNDRSGGTELVAGDRNDQVKMAAECIRLIGAKRIFMARGTPYHTGQAEDWEDTLAQIVSAEKVEAHGWLDINGVVFDYRHHVAGSQIPHGRHTAIARDRLWNLLWSEQGQAPKSDIIIRSHVHYHAYCGAPGWLALTTPALQGLGSKFGGRIVSGTVDFGLVCFDVTSKGEYSWKASITRLAQKSVATKI